MRPLFDRVHGLVLECHPEAEVALAYGMPAYRVGRRRLSVGVWKHGVSIYGFRADRDGGFVARHPTLSSGKGTLRLRPRDAEQIGRRRAEGAAGRSARSGPGGVTAAGTRAPTAVQPVGGAGARPPRRGRGAERGGATRTGRLLRE